MTWTYHDLTVNGVGFEEKDMEKIFLTILICFDLFIMCSILWDSFESNIFELDVVSMSCQCRFHCWTPGFASLILGQPLHARRKSRCGLQEAAPKLPKKQRQVSMHFKSSDRKQMLKHVGNLETHLHYGTMICLHSLGSLMFQHG